MEFELLKRLEEADKDYLDPAALNATQKKLADELVEIQRHINDVNERLKAFKAKKAEIDPILIEAIKKLESNGVLLEKALLYLSQGKTVPSFKAVYEAVEEKLKPAAKELLTKAYEKLTVEREPSLIVKMKSESIIGTIGAWLKSKFMGMVDNVTAATQEVARLIGVA